MPRNTVAVLCVMATAAFACDGAMPAAPPICPDDALTACPSPAPAFAADADPILRVHCVKCHAPGQMAARYPFETYDQIAPVAGDINLQLQLCAMPPAPEPPLTAEERQVLFGWILCGALDD